MHVQDDVKPYDTINVTPMLDLAYVLLVVFILMTTASVQGMKITMPTTATNTQSLAKPKMKAITVNNEGRISLDAAPVTQVVPQQQGGAGNTLRPFIFGGCGHVFHHPEFFK